MSHFYKKEGHTGEWTMHMSADGETASFTGNPVLSQVMRDFQKGYGRVAVSTLTPILHD